MKQATEKYGIIQEARVLATIHGWRVGIIHIIRNLWY
jgi:hypothetical protein